MGMEEIESLKARVGFLRTSWEQPEPREVLMLLSDLLDIVESITATAAKEASFPLGGLKGWKR